jgi:hypothetical protein
MRKDFVKKCLSKRIFPKMEKRDKVTNHQRFRMSYEGPE